MKVFITAEIGINHGRSTQRAINLIRQAKEVGADAVKFQLWQPDTFPHLENYRFDFEQLKYTKEFAESLEIEWFCTPFDINSAQELSTTDMNIWKIPSNRAVWENESLLDFIVDRHKNWGCEVFVSTGCCTFSQLQNLFRKLEVLDDVVVFHCVSEYPTKPERSNLSVLKGMMVGNKNVGYSDHTGLIEIPVAAVGMGATAIECHITLDKQDGLDGIVSYEPGEFKKMVQMIRRVEVAI